MRDMRERPSRTKRRRSSTRLRTIFLQILMRSIKWMRNLLHRVQPLLTSLKEKRCKLCAIYKLLSLRRRRRINSKWVRVKTSSTRLISIKTSSLIRTERRLDNVQFKKLLTKSHQFKKKRTSHQLQNLPQNFQKLENNRM